MKVINYRYQQFDVEKIITVYFFCVAFFSYFVSNNFKNLKTMAKKVAKKAGAKKAAPKKKAAAKKSAKKAAPKKKAAAKKKK